MRFGGNKHGGNLSVKFDFSINVSPLGAPRSAICAARRALKKFSDK